jgi:hypothetical protein
MGLKDDDRVALEVLARDMSFSIRPDLLGRLSVVTSWPLGRKMLVILNGN